MNVLMEFDGNEVASRYFDSLSPSSDDAYIGRWGIDALAPGVDRPGPEGMEVQRVDISLEPARARPRTY